MITSGDNVGNFGIIHPAALLRCTNRSEEILQAAGYVCYRPKHNPQGWNLAGISTEGTILVAVRWGTWPAPEDVARMQRQPGWPTVARLVHRYDGLQQPEVIAL